MTIHTTVSGDTFDSIAFEHYGTCAYVNKIYKANTDCRKYFFFPAGIKVNVPDLDSSDVTVEQIAAWRR